MEKIFANTYTEPVVSMVRKLLLTMKFNASMMPIRKPEATMAGMMGTKMSPRVLMARWYQGARAAAACFTSSLLPPSMPASRIKASYTLFTVPVPKMI